MHIKYSCVNYLQYEHQNEFAQNISYLFVTYIKVLFCGFNSTTNEKGFVQDLAGII